MLVLNIDIQYYY